MSKKLIKVRTTNNRLSCNFFEKIQIRFHGAIGSWSGVIGSQIDYEDSRNSASKR